MLFLFSFFFLKYCKKRETHFQEIVPFILYAWLYLLWKYVLLMVGFWLLWQWNLWSTWKGLLSSNLTQRRFTLNNLATVQCLLFPRLCPFASCHQLPDCVFLCILRSWAEVERFPHALHLSSFSPVCCVKPPTCSTASCPALQLSLKLHPLNSFGISTCPRCIARPWVIVVVTTIAIVMVSVCVIAKYLCSLPSIVLPIVCNVSLVFSVSGYNGPRL